ncbi:SseB family protein [Arthrobacter sp. MYb227]|uniref:SseB family protein n=1 Tax=Arthrobacter sp. MYb227 TaxID=1848601 RepID=UPI0015E44C07|nr:SseB family protein [Arthrobacter sp. MYb227]
MSEENQHSKTESATDENITGTQPQTTRDINEPITHFEMMIRAGQNDPALSGQVIASFMRAEVYFLSREKVTGETKNAQPMLLQNAAGQPVIALFTDLSRIPGTYIDAAPYGVQVLGATIARSLIDTGFVINPGHPLSFEIDAEGVKTIREDFNADGTFKGTSA